MQSRPSFVQVIAAVNTGLWRQMNVGKHQTNAIGAEPLLDLFRFINRSCSFHTKTVMV